MAGLPRQNIPLVFTQGVDTKTNAKVLPAGKLLRLENGSLEESGSLKHRKGKVALSKDILGGTSLESPKVIKAYKNELLQFANNTLYSYSESNEAWVERGPLASLAVESAPIVRNTATQSHPDSATLLGVTVFAWEDSRGGIRVSVVDEATGLPIQSDVELTSSGSRPRVTAGAAYIYIHYADSGNTFKCRKLSPGSPLTFDAAITLASDMNASTPNFDIFRFGTSLVYCYHTNGSVVQTGYLKSDGDIAGLLDGYPAAVAGAEAGTNSVAVIGRRENDTDDAIYTFYHNGTQGLRCIIYSTELSGAATVTIDSSTTQMNQIGVIEKDGTIYVFYEENAAQTYNRLIRCKTVNKAGTVSTGGVFIRSLGLTSKPFLGPDEAIYLVAVHESDLQPTYFTLRLISETRAFVVNTFAKDEAGGLHSKRSQLSNVTSLSDSTYLFPSRRKSRLVSEEGTLLGIAGVQSTVFDFEADGIFQSQEIGDNLHITGGVLQAYDGRSPTEHGFFFYPENLSNAITTTTGSLESGTRLYSAVYEWTDNQGNIHRSAPSVALSVTNAANDKNTLTIPTLRITEKKAAANRSEVSIALYRTVVDGTLFYRVNSVTSPTANSTTANSITIEDNVTDATIIANEILYTTGGEVDNIIPDSASAIGDFGDRLILNSEDPNVTQYSKKRVKGLGLAFNDTFNFRADQGGAKIYAYSRLDDKLCIFKEKKILVQVGQGPNPTGSDDDFRTPEALPSDVVTRFPQSLVEYPEGLIFKSEKGFYRLTRGLQTDYIGKEVEAYNDKTVTSAVLIADQNQVRFTHSDGPTLVYDYFTGQWGTHTNEECLSAVSWRGSYCILKSDGTVYKESDDTWLDNGSWEPMVIETGWISLAGLNGYKRVYEMLLECEKLSDHRLRIYLSYDFVDDYLEAFEFNTSEKLGSQGFGDDDYYGQAEYYGGADGRYTVSIRPKRQKCSAIKIKITDANDSGIDGPGLKITSLSFSVGMKSGMKRVGSSQTGEPGA